MKVQFLGSGDAFGSGGRLQACSSIRVEGSHLLLDCGASSLIAMRHQGLDPASVDAIVISHLHGDHFGGLPFLVLDQQFGGRTRPLVVAGPPGLSERTLQAMENLFPGSSQVERRFDLRFLELRERHESRHKLARTVFHGRRGQLRQPCREGMEDQLGALGLVVNVMVYGRRSTWIALWGNCEARAQ